MVMRAADAGVQQPHEQVPWQGPPRTVRRPSPTPASNDCTASVFLDRGRCAQTVGSMGSIGSQSGAPGVWHP